MNAVRRMFAALGIAIALGVSGQALANPTLRLQITDNVGAPFDVDMTSTTGLVSFNGAIGIWNANVTTGVGFPILDTQGHIDLNSVNSSTGAGHLTIILTQTGSNLGTGSAILSALNAIGGTLAFTGGHIDWTALINGQVVGTGSNSAPGAFGSNQNASINIGDLSNVTLQIVVDIFHNAAGVTSFDDNLRIPEPSSLLLLGMGLLGLAVTRRRRKS